MDVHDIVAIQEVLALYGHVIDEREWSRLDEVFTDDHHFHSSTGRVFRSLDELRAYWLGPEVTHPIGHHVTNIIVTPVDEDTASCISKGLYVRAEDQITSAVYRDVVVRTAHGWRLRERRITVHDHDRSTD